MLDRSRPIAWGYGRVSTSKADQFYSPMAQREAIERHYRNVVSNLPDAPQWGDIFFDEASAKRALCERPAGKILDSSLQSGDHLIIAKTDRAFRVNSDQYLTTQTWTKRGIKLHFLDIPVPDVTSPEGELIVGMLALVAQFERRRCGQRTRDVAQWKHANGLPTNGMVPIGWSRIGKKRASRFIENHEEREQAEAIKRLYESFHRSRDKTIRAMRRNKQTFRSRTVYQHQLVKIARAVDRYFPLPNGSLITGRPSAIRDEASL
jgi:DNA invertase Pin-like site-specific DNA recombinase